jgi:CheY-like chemotaxis protein/nitrogen-specific signal transduction histidine kinase
MRASSPKRPAERAARLERRRATARLRRLRGIAEARSRAIAVLAHELREPINAVLGMARLLQETALDAEQMRHVGDLVEAAEALATLVNDVLDLARIDAGRVDLSPVDFVPAAFFGRLAAMVRPRCAARGVTLVERLDPALPPLLRGDAGRLRQVLLNLLGNAVKFTERGTIELAVRVRGKTHAATKLEIRVTDTGPGIAADRLAQLFKPFVQAGASTQRGFGGSGLGLVIARRIVETMGGRLELASRLGRGTRATVRLSLPRPAPSRPTAEAVPLEGMKLLVCVSQRRSRTQLEGLARGWGMVSRSAASAQEARRLLEDAAARADPFDILILDDQQGPDGVEALARELHAMPLLAGTRLALLVSAGLRGDAARARAAGFDAYLPAAPTAELFREALSALLASDSDQELVTAHSLAERRPSPRRVLVVDDNPVNLRLAAILLERAGHGVRTATSGREAVQLVEDDEFDVVLMDMQMPEVDGLEATRRIRALGDTQRAAVPILAVTANAFEGDAKRCLAAGMDGFLTKPIDGAALVRAVARAARPPAAG